MQPYSTQQAMSDNRIKQDNLGLLKSYAQEIGKPYDNQDRIRTIAAGMVIAHRLAELTETINALVTELNEENP